MYARTFRVWGRRVFFARFFLVWCISLTNGFLKCFPPSPILESVRRRFDCIYEKFRCWMWRLGNTVELVQVISIHYTHNPLILVRSCRCRCRLPPLSFDLELEPSLLPPPLSFRTLIHRILCMEVKVRMWCGKIGALSGCDSAREGDVPWRW